jgi:hypothetical protein
MHTRERDAAGRGNGLGFAAKQVADHARSLIRLELELAKLELTKKLSALGIGIGLLVGAGIVAIFAVAFLLATVAAAFALFLATWLALLVTGAILVALAVGLGLLGLRFLKRATPPVPEQAIHEARRTGEAIKTNGGH